MTLIQALRFASKCLNHLNVYEVAILKDETYGYVGVTTPECVAYHLKNNRENVLVVYKKYGWHAPRVSYTVMSMNTPNGTKPGPLLLRPRKSKNNPKFFFPAR